MKTPTISNILCFESARANQNKPGPEPARASRSQPRPAGASQSLPRRAKTTFFDETSNIFEIVDENQTIVVHVVYYNSTENISTAQVQSQIDILNEDFRRLNADAVNTPAAFQSVAADCEIEFCLATTDPNGNSTTGITRTSTSQSSFGTNDGVKYSSSGGIDAWNTSEYMNIWVCYFLVLFQLLWVII